MQTLRGPADPLLDPGPWTLDLEALTLMLSWDDLGLLGSVLEPSWGSPGSSWGYLGRTWGYLGPFWGHLGAAQGHLGVVLEGLGGYLGQSWTILGLSWKNLVITWVQGHVLEMPKSLPLGACAAKTLA